MYDFYIFHRIETSTFPQTSTNANFLIHATLEQVVVRISKVDTDVFVEEDSRKLTVVFCVSIVTNATKRRIFVSNNVITLWVVINAPVKLDLN